MCWEMDYEYFAALEKAKKAERAHDKRAGVIGSLLSEANTKAETAGTEAPAKEPVPAK